MHHNTIIGGHVLSRCCDKTSSPLHDVDQLNVNNSGVLHLECITCLEQAHRTCDFDQLQIRTLCDHT